MRGMVWVPFAFVGMFWLLAFIAALLLSSPILFDKLPRRHRFRLPTADELPRRHQAKSEAPRESRWFLLLLPILVPLMIALLVLVLIPAFAAMWLCVICQNYRYCRRTTYRALRRRHAALASCLSYPTAFAVFVRKIATSLS